MLKIFEEFTQEKIFAEALSSVQDIEVSTVPGSLVYNSAALMATMLEDAFDRSEEVYLNAFPDTCDREHLIRFARAKGLTVKGATKAEYKIKANVKLPVGCELTGGDVDFVIISQGEETADGTFLHTAECTTAGNVGDNASGALDVVEEVAGFEEASIEKQTKKSTEDEDTEAFRERYFSNFAMPGQFGNRNFYQNAALAFDGVGAVRVSTGANSGAVVLTVVDKDGQSADTALCSKIQSEIQKPICHTLTVGGAVAQNVNFSISVTKSGGMTEADAKAAVKKVVEEYISEINLKYWKNGALKVRLPIIQMRIFEIENITDCEIEAVNGSFTVEISEGKIAGMGDVNVTVA